MVKYWSKAGQKVVRRWSEVGQKMVKNAKNQEIYLPK
jgi:hypothetical protein